MTFAVRVARDPSGVAEAIRRAVAAVDSGVPLFGVRSQVEQIDIAVRQERVFAWLASGFGLLALLLACLGVYGTLAYGVERRTPEIGVRMALGATRGHVVAMILRESLAPVAVGVAAGVAGALATTRFLESLLFEVRPRDVWTIAAMTLALVVAALIAAWMPSRRASGVDPVTALRCD
jgi:predicted lysophospholipase L1 biosynthesis ABC-type transport system permease subunit